MAETPGKLSPKQIQIHAYAEKLARSGRYAGIVQAARECSCSPSTICEAAQRLGYEGWPDMYHHLAHLQKSSSYPEEYLGLKQTRDALIASWDRCCFTYGAGDGAFAADYMRRVLAALGVDAMPFSHSALIQQARRGRAGILFAMNESGVVLADDVRFAKELGYAAIAFTGNRLSPVARLADIAIILKSTKSKAASYSPDFYCARIMVFTEYLAASLEHGAAVSIDDALILRRLGLADSS